MISVGLYIAKVIHFILNYGKASIDCISCTIITVTDHNSGLSANDHLDIVKYIRYTKFNAL